MDVLKDFGFHMIFDIARPEPAGPFPGMGCGDGGEKGRRAAGTGDLTGEVNG